MEPIEYEFLVINGGSSSIKFTVYRVGAGIERQLHGRIERIGLSGMNLTFSAPTIDLQEQRSILLSEQLLAGHFSAVKFLVDWLEQRQVLVGLRAIGHRVVHGMDRAGPEIVTSDVMDALRRIGPCDPEHMPMELELIDAFRRMHPKIMQIVCYDTSFHRDMPRIAKLLPIPRRFDAKGIHRFGFHGLSYSYLIEQLFTRGDPAAIDGRVILAHLGNGASLAAVRDGKSVDTSMGFTPNAGMPMGTRTGDLDPGLPEYFARAEGLDAVQFQHVITHESGLLGISETSSDMRDLLDRQTLDVRAAEAVQYFCYQAKKWIGAYAAVLGGLDTLVFSGGIGEGAPLVRSYICHDLHFLGIQIDALRNERSEGVISVEGARVTVRVIATDEELMMARLMVPLCSSEVGMPI